MKRSRLSQAVSLSSCVFAAHPRESGGSESTGPRVLFGSFHMWLPIYGFTEPDIVFLKPDAYTTLTAPSDASNIIATGTYDAYSNSLYLNSGRGNTTLDVQNLISAHRESV